MGLLGYRRLDDALGLTGPSDARIDRAQVRKPPTVIVLDIASSERETRDARERSACDGHFDCACYHPPFVSDQFCDLERRTLLAGNV